MMLRPDPALAPFVERFGWYESDLPPARETSVPTGRCALMVNLDDDELRWYDAAGHAHRRSGIGVCAARPGPVTIDTAEQRRTIYVEFRPGGSFPFFPHELDEPVVDLADLWTPSTARDLRDRMLAAPTPHAALLTLQAALAAKAARPLEVDRAVVAAAAALDRGARVAEVSDRLGTTTGTLRRWFAARVGLTPKRYGRIRRLHRLLDGVVGRPDVDWSRAAADSGYFDQAHMVNDFRELTGVTPGAYRPRSVAERNHVPA
jgi:AraC-like DNA-binding protein